MKLPRDFEKIATLYLYDELNAKEKQEFEAHIRFNAASSRQFEEMQSLNQLLDHKLTAAPSDVLLDKLRLELRQWLRNEQKSLFTNWLTELFSRRRSIQIAVVAVALMIGLFIGRFSTTPGAVGLKKQFAEQSELDENISNIDHVKYEPKTGLVTVHYQTIQDKAVIGDMNNPHVRNLLTHAIRTEPSPGRRLSAIKATQGQTFADSNLEAALIFVMRTDSVDGVRLKAAKSLLQLPTNPDIQTAFINVLLKDKNPAMRIAAIDALEKSARQEVVDVFQTAIYADKNDFVRLKAARAIEKREPR